MNTVKNNASQIGKKAENKVTVYDIIVNKIIAKIDEAEATGKPFYWVRPWDGCGAPMSYTTQKEYKGVNLLLLEGGEYITFKQLMDVKKSLGYEKGSDICIKKGAKSQQVFFASQRTLTKEEKEKKRKIREENAKMSPALQEAIKNDAFDDETEEKGEWFYRYYNVFSVQDDVEGLEPHVKINYKEYTPDEKHQKADKYIKAYFTKNKIDFTEQGMKAQHTYSNLFGDAVNIPKKRAFKTQYSYYSVLFHEAVHSTRQFLKKEDLGKRDDKSHKKTDKKYSYEELVAQIGSCFLLNYFGILPENEEFDGINDIAYIKTWADRLKESKRMIVMAANDAQKAMEFIIKEAEQEISAEPVKEITKEAELVKEVTKEAEPEKVVKAATDAPPAKKSRWAKKTVKFCEPVLVERDIITADNNGLLIIEEKDDGEVKTKIITTKKQLTLF